MSSKTYSTSVVPPRRAAGALLAVAAGLMLGACSQVASGPASSMFGSQPTEQTAKMAATSDTRSDLEKATDYWGKEYAKNPRDGQIALNYARNLKAMGEKRQALAVLQQTVMFNASHRGVISEYGRLALELDQVTVAQKLLEQADDPANPDWRVISARGTVLAKQSKYREAIPFYEKALTLAPDQPSVLSNLALAHAMEGNADKAEPLLKRAAAASGNDARVAQNLALVLGLQGKHDEAKIAAPLDATGDSREANADFMRQMVKADAKPLAVAETRNNSKAIAGPEFKGQATDDAGGWAAKVAEAPARPAR